MSGRGRRSTRRARRLTVRAGIPQILAGLGAVVVALALWFGLTDSRSEAQTSAAPLKAAPDGRKLVLTFADEFDDFRRFDGRRGLWRTMYGDGKKTDIGQRTIKNNKEAQVYVDPDMADALGPMRLNPFSTRGGVLRITADRTPPGLVGRLEGYRFTSGLITSQPSFSQTYGYFEMRARTPKGKGLWPAFWMLPADLSWPPEIDVMENIGDPSKAYVTSHSGVRKSQGKEVPIRPGEFHTFAVAWDREHLTWFIDGRQVERQTTPADMHKPMFLLANMAMGGDWAGVPDETTPFPAAFEIDFIRAYRFAQ